MCKCFYHSLMILMLWVANIPIVWSAALLEKNTAPGFVMPETALYTSCVLDDEGFLIMKSQINGLASKKNVAIQVDATDMTRLKNIINEAAKGSIKKPEAQVADAPSTTYYAYQKLPNGSVKKVFLVEDTGITNANTINNSPAALTLRKYIDALCK